MKATLASHGYRNINIDAGWASSFDEYGRPVADPKRFPGGITALAKYIHRNGQKIGIYMTVGMYPEVFKANPRILGTRCRARDILLRPLSKTNGWMTSYAIDWTNPCSQRYVESIAAEFAAWGIDLLKLDGVIPGSLSLTVKQVAAGTPQDNRGDVAAWAKALRKTGRPIWLTLSWWLSPAYAAQWRRDANAVRITGDIECYCKTTTNWFNVVLRIKTAPQWVGLLDDTTWPDLDSVDIGSGKIDGLTDVERQTVATFWAINAGPFYIGDDLTKLDARGRALLTNDAVLEISQSRRPLRPLPSTASTDQPVWVRADPDGSVIVAAFNTSEAPATVTVPLDTIGVSGPSATVTDLWTGRGKGQSPDTYTVALPAHGSSLVRIKPTMPH